MGSVSAVAQGLKIKKFSYAKSGETLKGEKLYARTRDAMSREREQGYAPTPWILYLENGGTVQLELPDGQKHQVGLGKSDFTYDESGQDMYVHVRVVPYAVPYLGELRLHDLTTSDRSLVRLTSPDPEGNEEFYQYTINSDNDLKLLTMNTSPGPAYLMMSQSIPTQGYWYGENLASQVDFAKGVSVDQLKQIAVSQRLDPKDFVVQVGIYGGDNLIYSDIYRDRAKIVDRLTWIRIIDKRPQIKKVTLTTKISPVGAGSVLINEASQSSIQVDQGTQVRLKARVASEEYEFDHWEDAPDHTLGNAAEFIYVVKENTTLSAHFKKKEYVLKAVSSDETLGSVNPAELTVKAGDEARFTATAKENAIFKRWERKGAAEERNTPVLRLTNIQEASEWIAVFEKKAEEKYYTLKAVSSNETLGTVEPAELKVKAGGEVTFTATAKENAIFKGWKKGLAEVSVTGSVLKLTNVQEASEWTAVFEKKEFEVKASSNDLTLGSVEPAMLTVKAGGEVTFTATAKENVIFKGWKQKGSAEVSFTGSVLKLTNVQEASEWTAVFEKKASTPEVGAVDLQFGQREAILTWAPGSATSWQIKLYRSDTKLVKTILTQLPRVELESLVPGEVYRYELVAKRQGKLDSQVKQGTFKTDQFNEREALAPYLKNFSKLLRGKAFDLIWMDVNLSEFDQETPIYEYYWQLNETSPKVLLIPDGKQLTLDTNQVGGCLIILIKSGDTLLYEVRYELDK